MTMRTAFSSTRSAATSTSRARCGRPARGPTSGSPSTTPTSNMVDEITRNGPVGWRHRQGPLHGLRRHPPPFRERFHDSDHRPITTSGSANSRTIWSFVDEVIVAGPTTDEDKGYGIVFDGDDTIFVTGTMIETDESYNIWMAKYDTDLNPLDSVTINGPVDGEDVAYLMTIDDDGHLYHSGTYTETFGRHQYLARPIRLNADSGILDDGGRSGRRLGHRHRSRARRG